MKTILDFNQRGKASFILGGQFGSEAKGAAAAWLAMMCPRFDIVTTNAAAQAGHTSVHGQIKSVVFHLPTAPLIKRNSTVYLNSGCIIDPQVLQEEVTKYDYLSKCRDFYIDPMAAIITQECKDEEGRDDSAQTQIASTRKGVGVALARKVLRSGITARASDGLGDLSRHVLRIDLNDELYANQNSVLVEIPQGYDLSNSSKFYPHCTSRNCTIGQAMSDANIHPDFAGPVALVLRTYPIRVGNIQVGDRTFDSGGVWEDQRELKWEDIGQEPEITTVTKRVRRLFSWSRMQVNNAIRGCRPHVIYLSHCDYVDSRGLDNRLRDIRESCNSVGIKPIIVLAHGPSTSDARIRDE